MKNIKILGAGLSGLTCAINLAKAGYHVEVFESKNDCGKRFHGDFQGFENWSSKTDSIEELKKMCIQPSFDYQEYKAMHFSDGKELLKLESEKPFFIW